MSTACSGPRGLRIYTTNRSVTVAARFGALLRPDRIKSDSHGPHSFSQTLPAGYRRRVGSAGRIAGTLASLGAAVDVVSWTRTLQSGQVALTGGSLAAYRFREWDTTQHAGSARTGSARS